MKNFKRSSDSPIKNNSKSNQFNYTKLYNYTAKLLKKKVLNDTEQTALRRRVQKSILDNDFIYDLIKSGFVDDNKEKQKFELIKPEIDNFLSNHKID